MRAKLSSWSARKILIKGGSHLPVSTRLKCERGTAARTEKPPLDRMRLNEVRQTASPWRSPTGVHSMSPTRQAQQTIFIPYWQYCSQLGRAVLTPEACRNQHPHSC